MRRHRRITEDEAVVLQKARIKRIVGSIGPDLEACFNEDASDISFVVRLVNTRLIVTPAIRRSAVKLLEMSDEDVRTLMYEASKGSLTQFLKLTG